MPFPPISVFVLRLCHRHLRLFSAVRLVPSWSLVLSCPAWSCPLPTCLILLCLARHDLFWIILSYAILHSLVPSCPVRYCLVSCFVLSASVSFYLFQSYAVLSIFALSCPNAIWPCPVLSSTFLSCISELRRPHYEKSPTQHQVLPYDRQTLTSTSSSVLCRIEI